MDSLRPAVHVDHAEQGGQLAAQHLLRLGELSRVGSAQVSDRLDTLLVWREATTGQRSGAHTAGLGTEVTTGQSEVTTGQRSAAHTAGLEIEVTTGQSEITTGQRSGTGWEHCQSGEVKTEWTHW